MEEDAEEYAVSEKISIDRLRNTRAWAAARPDMSGSAVIIGAIDEAIESRDEIERLEARVRELESRSDSEVMDLLVWLRGTIPELRPNSIAPLILEWERFKEARNCRGARRER